MCFNRFDLFLERLPWVPTFYAVVDDRVAADIAETINEMVGLVRWAFLPDLHPAGVDFRTFVSARPNLLWLHPDRLSFSDDLPYCGINKSVTNVGLQVLHYLGVREIYLVGVDMDYALPQSTNRHNARDVTGTSDDDPNHFDPRYFGAGSKYHVPRLEETLLKYRGAADFFSKRGTKVYNAGVGGKLDVFPRVRFETLFPLDRRDEVRLALSVVGIEADADSLARAVPDATPATSIEDFGARTVITSATVGASLVAQVIVDYLPIGPVQDELLFVRRSVLGQGSSQ